MTSQAIRCNDLSYPLKGVTNVTVNNSAGKQFPWLPAPLANTPLKKGCYSLQYTPPSSPTNPTLEGTLRVQYANNQSIISGDLYNRDPNNPPTTVPTGQVPHFPIKDYAYYLRATKIKSIKNNKVILEIEFELYCYIPTLHKWINKGSSTASLTKESTLNSCYKGKVKDTNSLELDGNLSLRWVATTLRQAELTIFKVEEKVELPLNNGAEEDWGKVFQKADWQLNLSQPPDLVALNDTVEEKYWREVELHQILMSKIEKGKDSWHYYFLCVHYTINSDTAGIMFDSGAADSDSIPRQGFAIASNFNFPNHAFFGAYQKKLLHEEPKSYLGVTMHELGHALNLQHPEVTESFNLMTSIDDLARCGSNHLDSNQKSAPIEFPSCFDATNWTYVPKDVYHLRHAPDIVVCPGGIPLDDFSDSLANRDAIRSDIAMSMKSFTQEGLPLAAPVRLQLKLTNTTDHSIQVPADLSFKNGNFSGIVTQLETKAVRTFKPLVSYIYQRPELIDLEPNHSISPDLMLLSGGDGPLFPKPGSYQIDLTIVWETEERRIVQSVITPVTIAKPKDKTSVESILNEPDILLALVIGDNDYTNKGVEAIQKGFANKDLKRHYAAILARLVAKEIEQNKVPDEKIASKIDEMASYLDNDIVVTLGEIKRILKFVETLKSNLSYAESLAKITATLQQKLDEIFERTQESNETYHDISNIILKQIEGSSGYSKSS